MATAVIGIKSTPDSICKSPLNNSRSKTMFSFSKSDRFPKNIKFSTKSFYYNLPDKLT
jgi:hypothetical protein